MGTHSAPRHPTGPGWSPHQIIDFTAVNESFERSGLVNVVPLRNGSIGYEASGVLTLTYHDDDCGSIWCDHTCHIHYSFMSTQYGFSLSTPRRQGSCGQNTADSFVDPYPCDSQPGTQVPPQLTLDIGEYQWDQFTTPAPTNSEIAMV